MRTRLTIPAALFAVLAVAAAATGSRLLFLLAAMCLLTVVLCLAGVLWASVTMRVGVETSQETVYRGDDVTLQLSVRHNGWIPIAPVTDEAALNELDAATVMGGLQRLLFYMKTLYPKAKSYFLITHRTFSAYPNSTYNYLPTTKNAAGYTQQDLHDALLTCCKVYDIEVIDVYKDTFVCTTV